MEDLLKDVLPEGKIIYNEVYYDEEELSFEKLKVMLQLQEVKLNLLHKIIEEANAELTEIVNKRGAILAAIDRKKEDHSLGASN